jgi:hypothetical protein
MPARQSDRLRLTGDSGGRFRPYLLELGPRLVGTAGAANPELGREPIRRGFDIGPTLRP